VKNPLPGVSESATTYDEAVTYNSNIMINVNKGHLAKNFLQENENEKSVVINKNHHVTKQSNQNSQILKSKNYFTAKMYAIAQHKNKH